MESVPPFAASDSSSWFRLSMRSIEATHVSHIVVGNQEPITDLFGDPAVSVCGLPWWAWGLDCRESRRTVEELTMMACFHSDTTQSPCNIVDMLASKARQKGKHLYLASPGILSPGVHT